MNQAPAQQQQPYQPRPAGGAPMPGGQFGSQQPPGTFRPPPTSYQGPQGGVRPPPLSSSQPQQQGQNVQSTFPPQRHPTGMQPQQPPQSRPPPGSQFTGQQPAAPGQFSTQTQRTGMQLPPQGQAATTGQGPPQGRFVPGRGGPPPGPGGPPPGPGGQRGPVPGAGQPGPPTGFSSQQQRGPPPMSGPAMGMPSGVGMGGIRPGMGAPGGGFGGESLAATLDAFETLNLGPGQAVPGPPGTQTAGTGNAATFPRPAGSQEHVEAAIGAPPSKHPSICAPEFARFTTNAVPNSQALKSRWHLPYGAIVHPMAETERQIPIANAGHTTIVRCKRCRTYMNPFMVWMDGGRRFSCNVCQMVNECPVDYFCALDGSGKRLDHDQRPELSQGSVEYVAPAEYMVRAPMPPTFVFAIDVSFAAASAGMISSACESIRRNLSNLPGDDRTRIAIITFDKSIHFYNMRTGGENPQMMVVGEIDDPFVPLPDELLVNLSESREIVEKLLDSIPKSFAQTQIVDSAMGPAIQAAFLVMNHVGGKLMLFQTAAPSIGIGKIKARDNPALYGTDREYTLRCPDDPFYKRFSAEASRFQICIDIFAGGSVYQDLPSLGALAKYTGGQCYYYPGFNKDKDSRKLDAELHRNLTREIAWESVMRIRCSKGLRISSFFGHFFVRSTDLLALPACDADKTFAVEITHEETLIAGQASYLQAALLYTSSQGERRIRVHTLSVPVVSEMIDLYKACDAGCTAALMAKVNVEKTFSSKLDVVRNNIQQSLCNALKEYRMLHMRGTGAPQPGSMVLPEKLKVLPVLTLGLLKSAALRGTGRDVNTDERAAVSHQVTTANVPDLMRLIYPSCYRVDQEAGPWGSKDQNKRVVLPSTTPAGLEYFDPTGVYLIDTGRIIILWIGSRTNQAFYSDMFGAVPQTNAPLSIEPPRQGSKLSPRINAVVQQLRQHKDIIQEVHVVRQGTPLEAHVMPYFVEDRMGPSGQPSYLDWMSMVQKGLMANPGK